MKLLITPTFILIMYMYKMKKMNITLMLMSFTLMLMLMNFNNKFPLMSNIMLLDMLTLIMLFLTTISVMLIILSTSIINSIYLLINTIFIILMMTFLSKNLMLFYIMFEAVLIPTMILITLYGKQFERLQASIYLIMYTVMASLPLLISIIFMNQNSSFHYNSITMLKFHMIIFLMMAFLAKMPMYIMHLWLPKAHVEAPLEGSMILAAILLKLGGYGIIRFIPMCLTSFNKLNYWIISISLMGATATSMNCIRQKDLKSLIAYSSVAHMGFVLASLFTMSSIGLMGAIIMMIAHGLSSSALFLLVNDLYFKYHTRNILMFKGMLTLMPNMTFWWFMFMALNMSAPPTINTFSEILMMTSLLSWINMNIMMIILMSFMAATFSIMMFINISHNNNNMLPSTLTQQKIFLSLFLHSIITVILIMKMEIMT